MKNLYEILQLNDNCSQDDIKKSYRKLALLYHPDKNTTNKDFNSKKFQEISNAYQILSNPTERKLYDLNKLNFNNFNYKDPHTIFNTIFKNVNPKILQYLINILDKIDITNTNNFNDFINNIDNLTIDDIFSLPIDYFNSKISKLINDKNPILYDINVELSLFDLVNKYHNINIGTYQRLPNNILYYYKKTITIETYNNKIILLNQGNFDTKHKYPSDLIINIKKNVSPFILYDQHHLLYNIDINNDEFLNGFYYQIMYPYNNKNYINIFIKEPYKSNLMYVIPNSDYTLMII